MDKINVDGFCCFSRVLIDHKILHSNTPAHLVFASRRDNSSGESVAVLLLREVGCYLAAFLKHERLFKCHLCQ